MLEIIIVILGFIVLQRQLSGIRGGATAPTLAPSRTSARLAQMVGYADRLYAEKKWLAAEKAYLSVLKLDHKNVTSYSHLGIIYSTQKNMPDAIECFEMAARLHPSGPTLQNLGLGFFDNHNYIKSVAAFEKSIMFEPTSQRYVGLSRSWAKLSNPEQSSVALEKAASLDPSRRILQLLAEAYEDSGRRADAAQTRIRLRELEGNDAKSRVAAGHRPSSQLPKP